MPLMEAQREEPSTRWVLGARLTRVVVAYWSRYRRLRSRPFALLLGQLLTFFVISLYVKLVQMRATAEYAAPWLMGGKFLAHCRDYMLFCGQEISLFAGLLVATVVWQRCTPEGGRFTRSIVGLLGFVVLPMLSAIEVLGLAHFAFFLAPLGPEEVRMIAWMGHVVSAGNVLELPEVGAGLVLVVAGYYVAPGALWLPRLPVWDRSRPAYIAAVLTVGTLAVLAPKPLVADALLVPHPLLWMMFGSRPQRIWAAEEGAGISPVSFQRTSLSQGDTEFVVASTVSAPIIARPEREVHPPRGRGRLTVKEHPTNVLIYVMESTRAASLAVYDPAAPAGRDLLRLRDEMVVFDQLYAPVPTSAHALFSMLYGVYPYLGPFWTSAGKTVVADSLAEFFVRAGYAAHFYITGDLNYDNVRSFVARGFERVLDINDWPGQEAFALLPWGRDDRLLVDEVRRFLSARNAAPFFLLAMTSNPHHPYSVEHLPPPSPPAGPLPPDDNGRTAYERLVDYDLQLLVELYEWMKVSGVAERTLLLALGDHGEAFGEHAGNFGHSAFIYPENVHVPCFILHPRRLGLPHHIAQFGSQVDLRATILDILGLQDAAPSDGMSLLRTDAHRAVAHFAENGVSRFGLRDAEYSYYYTPHVAGEQVFDRRSDPRETENIAIREASVTADYRRRLQGWEAQHQLSLARVLQ